MQPHDPALDTAAVIASPPFATVARPDPRSRGMSLEALAGLTGRSKGWLSKIENGHSRLERRQDIAAIAEALEVPADSLVGEPAPEIQRHTRAYNFRPLRVDPATARPAR